MGVLLWKIKSAGGPVVRISHDQMEAYLLLPMVNF